MLNAAQKHKTFTYLTQTFFVLPKLLKDALLLRSHATRTTTNTKSRYVLFQQLYQRVKMHAWKQTLLLQSQQKLQTIILCLEKILENLFLLSRFTCLDKNGNFLPNLLLIASQDLLCSITLVKSGQVRTRMRRWRHPNGFSSNSRILPFTTTTKFTLTAVKNG